MSISTKFPSDRFGIQKFPSRDKLHPATRHKCLGSLDLKKLDNKCKVHSTPPWEPKQRLDGMVVPFLFAIFLDLTINRNPIYRAGCQNLKIKFPNSDLVTHKLFYHPRWALVRSSLFWVNALAPVSPVKKKKKQEHCLAEQCLLGLWLPDTAFCFSPSFCFSYFYSHQYQLFLPCLVQFLWGAKVGTFFRLRLLPAKEFVIVCPTHNNQTVLTQ